MLARRQQQNKNEDVVSINQTKQIALPLIYEHIRDEFVKLVRVRHRNRHSTSTPAQQLDLFSPESIDLLEDATLNDQEIFALHELLLKRFLKALKRNPRSSDNQETLQWLMDDPKNPQPFSFRLCCACAGTDYLTVRDMVLYEIGRRDLI